VKFVRVTPHDVQQVEAFLRDRSDYVMFPLNNLTRFGLDGIDNLAPRMWRNGDGALSDILSVTKVGMVMPYMPSRDFGAAAAALSGRSLIGIIGPKQAVRGTQAALGLATADMELDADEMHFGAVYTPPALRGKGHARRAVALHLAQARNNGVRRATLFASAQNAIAAYTPVGFKKIGEWVLAIFKTPQVVP
jgi:ribosomal protein S18 acetylase RimI-like enzyme